MDDSDGWQERIWKLHTVSAIWWDIYIYIYIVWEESFNITVSTCPPAQLMHKNQQSPVQFRALTHISWGIFDITSFILSSVSLFFFLLYMQSFIISHTQKSQGVRSGKCGGYINGLPQPIQWFGKVWLRQCKQYGQNEAVHHTVGITLFIGFVGVYYQWPTLATFLIFCVIVYIIYIYHICVTYYAYIYIYILYLKILYAYYMYITYIILIHIDIIYIYMYIFGIYKLYMYITCR